MQYLTSLVIPVYNDKAGYLRECLASVVRQTHTQWEALVIDDGSTEGISVTAMSGEFLDKRIRVIRHEQNRGLSAARNTGIAASQGKRIAMVDSDDILEPNFLTETSQALDAFPECSAAYGDFRLFGKRTATMEFLPAAHTGTYRVRHLRTSLEQHFIRKEPEPDDCLWQVPVKELDASLYLRYVLPPGPGVLLLRDLAYKVGGYSEQAELKFGLEDWDYWLGAAEADASVVHVSRHLYNYRQHTASLISSIDRHEHRVREVLVSRHEPLLRDLGLYHKVLASGYRRSARAAFARMEPLTAARLGARALRLDPGGVLRAVASRF